MSEDKRSTWRAVAWLWLPVVAWMAAIFVASSQQDLPTPQSYSLDFILKKTGHVLEYGFLGLLTWRACRGSLGQGRGEDYKRTLVLTAAICGLYAATDELHQLFVPTRHGTLRDFLIDLAAIMAAVALVELWRRRRSDKAQL